MRNPIMVALVCAVVGLFLSLVTYSLSMAGKFSPPVWKITGPITMICSALPPILLSIVLLVRESERAEGRELSDGD